MSSDFGTSFGEWDYVLRKARSSVKSRLRLTGLLTAQLRLNLLNHQMSLSAS
jgi:hypothetical protein